MRGLGHTLGSILPVHLTRTNHNLTAGITYGLMPGIESLPCLLLPNEGSTPNPMGTESLEDYLQRIETEWATKTTPQSVDVFDELNEFEDFQPFN